MDDLEKLAKQFGGTIVPEQPPVDDLQKLAAQFGGTVASTPGGYGVGTFASDVGKLTGGAAVAGLTGTPEAIQASVRGLPQLAADVTKVEKAPLMMGPAGLMTAASQLIANKILGRDQAKVEESQDRGVAKMLNAVPKIDSLKTLTDWGNKLQANLNETVSPEMKTDMANFVPTGSLKDIANGNFKNLSLGANPTARGLAGQFAQVFGSAVPAMTATLVTKNPTYMAAMGFGQSGAEAVGNAREYIGSLDDKKLAENSPFFRQLVQSGIDPKQARAMTEEKAVNAAAQAEGIVGALGGEFTGHLLTGSFDKALLSSAKNRALRILQQTAKGALAEGAEEGIQETAEGIASDLGINKTVVKEIGADAFANLILGALGGAGPGGLKGAVTRPTAQNVSPAVSPVAPIAPAAPAPTAPLPPQVSSGLVSPEDLEQPVAPVVPTVAPKVEAAAPEKKSEVVHAIPMGENTEYQVIKTPTGYTANLFDKDSGNYVSGSTRIFKTDKFGDQAETKAMEFVAKEAEKAKPYMAPETKPIEIKGEELEDKLVEKGIPISSSQDAHKLFSNGHPVYGLHEQSEEPHLIRSASELDTYAPDQLIALPKQEAVEQPAKVEEPTPAATPVAEAEKPVETPQVEQEKSEQEKRNDQIKEIEKQIARIETNPDNVIGGEKAFNSGMKTELKPSIQKKRDNLNKQLDQLLDQAEEAPATEESPVEEKTQAEINRERQQAKKAQAQKSDEEKLVDAIKEAAYEPDSWKPTGTTVDDFIAKNGKKAFNTAVEMGLLDNKLGDGRLFPSNKFAYEVSPNYYESNGKKLKEPIVPAAKEEKPAAETPEIAKAKQDLEDALGDLAWLATKPTRMNITPEEEQKLMPILTRLMDAAFRLGYHQFKQAAKFVLDTIRSKFGDDAANKITLDHLQGAYIGMAGRYPNASPKKDVIGVESLAELGEEPKYDLATPEGKFKLAQSVSAHLLAGNGFAGINEARKFIADLTGQKVEANTASAKQADEAVEVGVVLAAREIAQSGESKDKIYDRLVDLYSRQPNLAVRSSTSVREQAYSTPAPLAYVASELAGINDKTTVYEPTAGNGMLLIAADPKNVKANELNSTRFEMLKKLLPGAEVVNKNAISYDPELSDVVIANPPFGATGETYTIEGKNTREIDHAIVYKALTRMPANGRAVLIVGGVRAENEEARREAYRAAQKRNFYYNLYKEYNVVDHFSVSGDMYTKQGASYPVDVIVIDGKGQSQRNLPAADLPQQIGSYEELKEKLNERMVPRENISTSGANVSAAPAGAGKPERLGERPSRQGNEPSAEGAKPTAGGRPSVSENGAGERGQPKPAGTSVSAEQPRPANEPERGGNRGPVSGAGEQVGPSGRAGNERNEPTGLGGPSVVSGTRVESGLKDRRGQETETGHQVAYEPHSNASSVGTLVPRAMAQSINNSLDEVERSVGNVDDYVAEALEMDPETLREKFSAEQIDALTLAIRNAEAGKGFIIGDQTGIGKGRVVAAMIKYALVHDKTPIFVTEKPNLYSDMIRDLDDIGMTKELALDTNKPKIFITNSTGSIPYTLLRNVNGEVTENTLILKAPKSGKDLDGVMKGMKDSLGDYKVIFTTYNQMQTVKGEETERQRFIKHWGAGNYMIFDESHNAGGSGETQARTKEQREAEKEGKGLATGRSAFVRELVNNADGTFFSSATYAKRPDVMDLYASTDMKLAVNKISELGEAIKNGGIPMQQIVANMLTKAGQYIRRERTFAGVSYDTVEAKVDKQTAENMATSMRDVLAFSRAKELVVKELQKSLDKSGGRASSTGEKTQIQGASFGNTMHCLIDQMLLSLKAKSSVDHAIARLKAGEKVVMTVANTMGSFLQEYANEMGIKNGDPVNLSFKDLYLRYLEKQRILTIKQPGQKESQKYRLTDQDLGPELVAQYNRIKDFIENAGFGEAPMSPIDYMHNELHKAGYKTEEITGRTEKLNYQSGIPILAPRVADIKQRVSAVRAFNNGTADVIILNQSGSTGISLHASDKFNDKRKRHMIIVQPENNIDTHMQMLGRVHRTGQVVAPAYSQMMADIPAEMRPAAVLLKKMASLNANTTASRKSAVTAEGAVDFMNEYGGQVAQEFLRDNPEVHQALGGKDALKLGEDPNEASEADIRKLTGYVPILPIKEQEEIYKDLIDRYNDLLERENSMGTNKLEAKAVDLGAETVSSTPITEAKNDLSPFAESANMERVDVKRTVKPFSKDEVQEMVKKNLNGQTAAEKSSSLYENMKSKGVEYAKDFVASLQAKGADQVRIDQAKGQLNLQLSHIKSILSNYRVGTPISVKNNQGVFLYGVVTDLEHKGKTKNPMAGSDWKMTIALANGDAKSINLSFSQIGSTYELTPESYVNWLNPDTLQAEHIPLMDMFDKGATVRREKRWMVTGNILAGFAAVNNIGQIMTYTKADGTEAQGILMPRTYDFEKAQREAPVQIKTADDAMRFMQEAGGVISSPDKILTINGHGRRIEFRVPKSKKQGGTYFLDSGLTNILGDFYNGVATTYDPEVAKKAIDYILNGRDETLIAATMANKAKEMFAPKAAPLANIIIKESIKDRNQRVRKEKIKEFKSLRQRASYILRKVAEGKTELSTQEELTRLLETTKELKADIRMLAPRNDTPEHFYDKALREYTKENISKEVLDVVSYIYNRVPSLLSGIKLSVTAGDGKTAGNFDPMERLVTLFKESGAESAVTIRHELMHSLEQMMSNQTRQALVETWSKSLQAAMKKYTDEKSQAYFKAVLDFIEKPNEETFNAATDKMPVYEFYQYLNPSEYWAVNAEKLMAAKMGTPWHRFVQFAKQLFEALKHVLGFDNNHAVYKAFNDLIKGETARFHKQSLTEFIHASGAKISFLNNVKDIDDLLAKHGRGDAPIHTSNTVMDKLLGGIKDAKDISAKLVDNPRIAVNNMVGNVDRMLLYTRVKNTDFTAGLTAADAAKYGRMLEDSQGRAVASVAMNQALKATRIGTQVIMLGRLVFDNTTQMFHAAADKYSMANIMGLKHQLEKQIGVQRAANVIQAYFEAKRSRSIVNDYLKSEGNLEDLLTQQADPSLSADRQLALLQDIEEARENLKVIGIALQKVNMSDEAIDDFGALEKKYPELREMMTNWNHVNRNMIDMMEKAKILSKQRADNLRNIKDYVPWQRIMDENSDPHIPMYTSKGVRNVNRESILKEGKTLRDIDDIVDNMLHNVMMYTRNSIKNFAANRIAQEYGTRNDKGKLKVFPTEDFSRGIVKILVNGRKINIQIADPLIAQSVIGIEDVQIPMNRIMSAVSNGLRRSITFSGVFQIKQLFMDAPTAALVSGVKNPLSLYGGVFASFAKGLTQKDPVVDILKSHGIGGYHSSARTAEHQYRQEIGLINKSSFDRVTSILDQIADASDFAQRRAVYVRVMKETGGFPVGGDQRKAILAATNIIDFDKRGAGTFAQMLNRTIAFMNAYAQQIDVLAQALAEPVAAGLEAVSGAKMSSISGNLKGIDRQKAIARLTVAAGLLTSACLLYAMAVGDDDEYKKLDDQTRMRNFYIPRSLMQTIGVDHALLIPMHTSASYFFKSIPEMLYNKITKEGTKDAIDNTRLRTALKVGAIDALAGPIGSGPIPTAAKPLTEIVLNHDFYTGGKVVPDSMKNLAAFKQYSAATSELGKWVSEATQIPFTGKEDANGNIVEGTRSRILSPIQADHVMRSLAGTVASVAMWGSNLIASNKPTPEERSNPLYGSFIAPDIPRGAEDLFYDLKTRSDQAMDTFKNLHQHGQHEEAKQWFEVNKGLIQANGFTGSAGSALVQLNQQIRITEDNAKLSAEEKRQRIDFYKNKKEEIAQKTMQFRRLSGL